MAPDGPAFGTKDRWAVVTTGYPAHPARAMGETEAEASPRGFFGRLLSAFNSADSSEGDEEAAAPAPAKGATLPGLRNLRRLAGR